MLDFYSNKYYTINDLVNIMQKLRGDNGCPWDKEQTHKSIRNNFIEEVYEAVEAIDTDNSMLLREELGDVLLQVVFHCQLESEIGSFKLDDVIDQLCRKLIIRHPHVFSDIFVDNTADVLENWENIKNETKGTSSYAQTLTDVPLVLPALIRAQKIGQRAARAGMDFESAESAISSLESEIGELKTAIVSENPNLIIEEIGDLLFSSVNVARKLGFSAEEALTKSVKKFISRFKEVEDLTRLDGIDMKSLSINELDVYWDKVKNSI